RQVLFFYQIHPANRTIAGFVVGFIAFTMHGTIKGTYAFVFWFILFFIRMLLLFAMFMNTVSAAIFFKSLLENFHRNMMFHFNGGFSFLQTNTCLGYTFYL